MQLQEFKNGAVVTFEKLFPSGMYAVSVRKPGGEIHDKIRCDTYSEASAYRRAFAAVAKNL